MEKKNEVSLYIKWACGFQALLQAVHFHRLLSLNGEGDEVGLGFVDGLVTLIVYLALSADRKLRP